MKRSEKERGLKMPCHGFENGGRGHEPRNVGSLQKLEKPRKTESYLRPPGEIQTC